MNEAPGEGRITTLDTIRGVAVMGIFSVNVIGFAMPVQAYFNPAAYGGTSGVNLLVWALNFILIDGKMRGLFTLLFGASTLLVIQKAEAAGMSAAAVHYRRMVWLLLFGLLHYYLLWFGDILSLYAVIGMIAFLFRRAPVRLLIAIGVALLGLDMVMMLGFSRGLEAAELAAMGPRATAETVAALRDAGSFLMPLDPERLAHDLALHRGAYGGLVREQLTEGLYGPLYQLVFASSETLGSILLGMAAFSSGFLTGLWSERLYRRIAAVGLTVGAAGYAWLAWRSWSSGFDPAVVAQDFFALSAPFRLLMMFGYAAAIILLARSSRVVAGSIAAAGRTAFSNYLGTSLLASALFMGWGLGLYGHLDRAQAWLIAPVFWLIMLLWSGRWLERFRFGPFEWAWRSLARMSVQPMRRRHGADSVRVGTTET